MISIIINILIGLFIWRLLPNMLKISDSKVKSFAQMACNIIGIIIVIGGAIRLVKFIVN